MLVEESYFFRTYELSLFRYLIHTNCEKNKIARNLSCCMAKKVNHIMRIEAENKKEKMFVRIDIIYDLVKQRKIKINCYFSTNKQFAYIKSFNEGEKIRHRRGWRCHYCSNSCCSNSSWLKKQV